jgi:hypothetical protein
MVSSPKGFFASLYDLSFDTFITPKIIQIVYIISLVVVGIWTLLFLISGFAPSYGMFGGGPSAGSILFHLIAAPIMFVVGSISARIYLEFLMAVFRIAENTDPNRRAP